MEFRQQVHGDHFPVLCTFFLWLFFPSPGWKAREDHGTLNAPGEELTPCPAGTKTTNNLDLTHGVSRSFSHLTVQVQRMQKTCEKEEVASDIGTLA